MANERNIDVRVRLKGAEQFKKGMKGVNDSLGSMGGWLDVTKGLLASDLIKNGIRKIINELGEAVDASIDFESALAGVAKTTDFSDVGLRNFGNQLLKLSEEIPIAATELAGLAETAGQLGIAKEDILAFTEVVAAMSVSTNMSAEDAATAFARMANIFGTSSDDYSRIGSSVVDLGNNFATTESEIVQMAQRMSGMAALVGMTEADVLAFATALSSIGMEADAGGSSMQKLFQQIEMAAQNGSEGFELIAHTANMSAEAMQAMWQADPAQAVANFLSGLGAIEQNGGSALDVLNALEIKEIRMTRSVLGLANAEGMLNEALATSRSAWTENNALANEATKRYETTASRIQIAQNKIDNANVTIGDSLKGIKLTAKEEIGNIAATWNEQARKIDLSTEIKEATAEFDAQKAVIDENAQSARFLADAIAGMGAPEAMDASGQREYIATMQALATLIPEINSIWDAETMSIEGGTEALYKNIDAAQALATAEAQLKKDRESADAYAIIEQSIESQRAQLAVYDAEVKTAQAAYDEFIASVDRGEINPDDIFRENAKYSDALIAAQERAGKMREDIEKSELALEEYAYVVDDFEQSSEDVISAYADMSGAASGMSDEQRKAVAGLEFLQIELDNIITKYEETQEAALAAINASVSKFEKIEMPEIGTPQEQANNLDSQIEFLNAYSDAIQKASEMGLDKSIIESLSTGTESDYATLASIVSGTEEDVALINQKYAEVAAAKTQLASDMAEAQTGLSTTVTNITELASDLVSGVDVGTDMYAKGANDIQQLINGMNSKIATLQLTASRIKSLTSSMAGTENTEEADGSHAAGLAYVPHDNYMAQLHRGEMVLTALEARAYRASQFADYAIPAALNRSSGSPGNTYSTTSNTVNNFGGVIVRTEQDAEMLAEKIANANRRKARGRGYT